MLGIVRRNWFSFLQLFSLDVPKLYLLLQSARTGSAVFLYHPNIDHIICNFAESVGREVLPRGVDSCIGSHVILGEVYIILPAIFVVSGQAVRNLVIFPFNISYVKVEAG